MELHKVFSQYINIIWISMKYLPLYYVFVVCRQKGGY